MHNALCIQGFDFLTSLYYWVAFLLLLLKETANKEEARKISMAIFCAKVILIATELMSMKGFRAILTPCLNAGRSAM